MNRVAFIGLGWMGETIADWCVENKLEVVGTTTSDEKLKLLKPKYQEVQHYLLGQTLSDLNTLGEVDILFYSIPPSSSANYVNESTQLVQHFVNVLSVKRIIYISSTSVYGSHVRVVDESSTVHPETENARKMAQVEEFLHLHYKNSLAIFRCGGLVGKKRHPAKYLAGKKKVGKPKAHVILVHLKDVVGFFSFQLVNFLPGVYNLVSPLKAPKKDYYQWASQQLGLDPIEFKSEPFEDKIVTCPAVTQLGYNYLFPSVYDYPLF